MYPMIYFFTLCGGSTEHSIHCAPPVIYTYVYFWQPASVRLPADIALKKKKINKYHKPSKAELKSRKSSGHRSKAKPTGLDEIALKAIKADLGKRETLQTTATTEISSLCTVLDRVFNKLLQERINAALDQKPRYQQAGPGRLVTEPEPVDGQNNQADK